MVGGGRSNAHPGVQCGAMKIEVVTVAQLRAQPEGSWPSCGREACRFYVTQRGEARAVPLRTDKYRAMMEQLGYLDDSLEVLKGRERRASGKERTPTLGAVKRELLGGGRVPR